MLNIDQLNISPEFICNLVLRAREFHAKEEITIPEPVKNSEYEYDWAQILADHIDDLTYLEIDRTITSLDFEQKVDIMALLFLGREDFLDLEDARQAAANHLPENFTDYLLSHPLLASYLEKALALFGYSCDE